MVSNQATGDVTSPARVPEAPVSGMGELLQRFCSVERSRAYLCQPWTRGGYTYATNGHIAVRVPALSDVPDFKNAPDASRLWKTEPTGAFIPAPHITLPKFVERQCLVCNGAGVFKDIDGEDECEACWGSGKTPEDRSAGFACMTFAVRYLRKMWELPGLVLSPEISVGDNPYFFRFDGGEGCLMQMRGQRGKHIELKISLANSVPSASGSPEGKVEE